MSRFSIPVPAFVALIALTACTPADTSPASESHGVSSSTSVEVASMCDIAPVGLGSGTREYDGVERRHNLTVPDGSGPFPAVISLHGVSGTKDHQDAATGLPAAGLSDGFVTLTPETAPGETAWSLDPTGTDVAYLLALADDLAGSPCVDEGRVYVAGFSNGAMMALLLSCLAPDRFAAVGAVGGLVELEGCDSGPAAPLVAVHGTADPSIGYNGAMAPTVVDLVGYEDGPAVPQVAAAWAERAGCATPPTETRLGPDRRVEFCDDVTLVAVEGGDHVWPGPNAGTALDANEVLWDFFGQHPAQVD